MTSVALGERVGSYQGARKGGMRCLVERPQAPGLFAGQALARKWFPQTAG
jgi:hypothetical protein